MPLVEYQYQEYQYSDDTQVYFSVPGQVNDAVDVLSLCLVTGWVWMGNRVQMSPYKMDWLWIGGELTWELTIFIPA